MRACCLATCVRLADPAACHPAACHPTCLQGAFVQQDEASGEGQLCLVTEFMEGGSLVRHALQACWARCHCRAARGAHHSSTARGAHQSFTAGLGAYWAGFQPSRPGPHPACSPQQANIRHGRVSWWYHGQRIATDLARALAFLHSRRLVHLDVKSSNVLLSRCVPSCLLDLAARGRCSAETATPAGTLPPWLHVSLDAHPRSAGCPSLHSDGTAKLGDLGMARLLSDNYVTGVVGTLAW